MSLYVDFGDRYAKTVLRPVSDRIFQKNLQKLEDWRNCFNILCQSYAACKKTFDFCHDRYDGYCLVYKGDETIMGGDVFRAAPVGFLREIDSNITDLSIIIKSSSKEEIENLMLGPTRFVNSDCDPNCEYDFTSDADIVRIRVLSGKSIRRGDEITVKYGDEFFEAKECHCKTCCGKRDAASGEGDPLFECNRDLETPLADTIAGPSKLPVVRSLEVRKTSPPPSKKNTPAEAEVLRRN